MCRKAARRTGRARLSAASSGRPAACRGLPRWRSRCRSRTGTSLKVAAPGLLVLDRLEERLEISLAEAARAFALDDLEKERRAVLERLGEELQEVAFIVLVDEDIERTDLLHRLLDLADALRELLVVRVGDRHELDAVRLQARHGLDDVAAEQRHVLHARAAVPLEVFVDLALLAAGRRLVDRELHD